MRPARGRGLAARAFGGGLLAALLLVPGLGASGCRIEWHHDDDEDEEVSSGPEAAAPEPGAGGAAARANVRRGTVLEFNLEKGAPEAREDTLLPAPSSSTYSGLILALDRAGATPGAAGLLLRFGSASLGWARTEELVRRLEALRATGLHVWCHGDELENTTAWLALRGCDEFWLAPGGRADTIGISGQVVYLKGALDRVDVQADFLAAGQYKSFAERFTRDGPSPAARESLLGVLQSLRATWLDSAREKAGAQPVSGLETGPFDPNAAQALGLVSRVGYLDELRREALAAAGRKRTKVVYGGASDHDGDRPFALLKRLVFGAHEDKKEHIALYPLSGAISDAGGGLLDDSGIVGTRAVRDLRRLAADTSVRAVVLRIDSPGGTVLASDLIWHEVMELRKVKPVVASLGDTAASGGYYIASASHRVFAEKTSIVGSIGVVMGKLVVGPAMEQLGVHTVLFPANPAPDAGERAAYASMMIPWTPAMRERMQGMLEAAYDLFVGRVVEGRGLAEDVVRKSAEGRIWSGAQGKERQLVDELGGLTEALAEAKRRAELPETTPVVIVGAGGSLLEALLFDNDDDARARPDAASLAARALTERLSPELRAFLASVEPLAKGPHLAAAMPYGLVLR